MASDSAPSYEDVSDSDLFKQVSLHNGGVQVSLLAERLLPILTNLSQGAESGAMYITFTHDRITLISDVSQLGVHQEVYLYPEPSQYSFMTGASVEDRRLGRIYMKVKFPAIKSAIGKDAVGLVRICKPYGLPDLSIEPESSTTKTPVACSLVSKTPVMEVPDSNAVLWTGPISELISALSPVCGTKSNHIYVYIEHSGKGIYFYTYHPVSAIALQSHVGITTQAEFDVIEKGTRCRSKEMSKYLEFKISKRGLKAVTKLASEKESTKHRSKDAGEAIILSLPTGGLVVEYILANNGDTHRVYLTK